MPPIELIVVLGVDQTVYLERVPRRPASAAICSALQSELTSAPGRKPGRHLYAGRGLNDESAESPNVRNPKPAKPESAAR